MVRYYKLSDKTARWAAAAISLILSKSETNLIKWTEEEQARLLEAVDVLTTMGKFAYEVKEENQ